MSVLARGDGGEVLVGPYTAARLGKWALEHVERLDELVQWTIDAEIGEVVDSYWLERDGLVELRLRIGPHIWRWRDVSKKNASATRLVLKGTGREEVL